MTALGIIQQASMALGFPRPTTIEDSSDTTSMRLLSCLNRALEDIVRQYKWQAGEFVRDYTCPSSPTARIRYADELLKPRHADASKKMKQKDINPLDVMQNIACGLSTHSLTDRGFTGFINNYIFNATTNTVSNFGRLVTKNDIRPTVPEIMCEFCVTRQTIIFFLTPYKEIVHHCRDG